MSKNKALLEIFKAQAKIKKMKKEHPEMTEAEIAEQVLTSTYGPVGAELFREVYKDPKKYKDVLKKVGVKSDL